MTTSPSSGRRNAFFVDRDGVLNEVVYDPVTGQNESPLTTQAVRLVAGVGSQLARLRQEGWLVVCVTNQPAAAKGRVSIDELTAIQSRVRDLLAADGGAFDAEKVCLHHPEGVVASLRGPCKCRKPAPGMLLSSAAYLDIDMSRSWMVGDTDTDVAAGLAAGCRTALITSAGTSHKRFGSVTPHLLAGTLREVVDAIIGRPESPND